MRVPLFPLPLVLFPGKVQTLRVFEPRHRAMLHECMRSNRPFGLVLARKPARGEEKPLPHTVGVFAHIAQVEMLPDGTYGIGVYGGDRFRVEQFHLDEPYLTAEVVTLPLLETESEQSQILAGRVRRMLDDYLEALTRASGFRFQIQEMPETPLEVAYLTAMVLQISNEAKQELLVLDHISRVLRQEIIHLASELNLMDWINTTLFATSLTGFGSEGWMNLN
ncbi:MAG: LON peptidase substrate-binding domain-containing protein [Chloroflexi bacterium]|nr:LON peptidase substrate-binding domain-containing protein [Chloroflexota bacterium]